MRRRITLLAVTLVTAVLAGCFSFTGHKNGDTVEGTITLAIQADDVNEAGVEFTLDNTTSLGTDTTAPYELPWDTTTTTNGTHSILARGTTGDGDPVQTTLNLIVKNPPILGSVHVLGDSLTIQTFFGHGYGEGAPADLVVTAGLGWKAQDVQPDATSQAANRRPEVQLVTIGTNDSNVVLGGDGWNAADLARFKTLLNTPDQRACKVLVLPGYGPGVSPAYAVELNEAHADLATLADARDDVIAVDWQQVINDNPGIIDTDGIHLASPQTSEAQDAALEFNNKVATVTPVAAQLRAQLYWQGMNTCYDLMATNPEFFDLAA